MAEETYQLDTEDLISEGLEEAPSKPPPARGVSVTAASSVKPASSAPPRPRFVPSAVSRPIKERSRTPPPKKPEEGPTSLTVKAASFYEEAVEAQRAGDGAAAIRHVKLAITFNPKEPLYQEFLKKLVAG